MGQRASEVLQKFVLTRVLTLQICSVWVAKEGPGQPQER